MRVRLSVLVGLAAAVASYAPALAGLPTFSIKQSGFGDGPEAVALGDVTGTSNADLVVANEANNTIAIFAGNGSGFASTATITITNANIKSPQGIVVADFDGVNGNDIAISNYSGSSVTIFRNNGSGGFGGAGTFTNVTVPANPLGIAAGRFRGAGQPVDLVVTTKSGSSTAFVTTLLNSGNGATFTRADLSGFDHPKRVLVGDFGTSAASSTRDGILDIVLTEQGSRDGIAVLYGNGTGGFSAADRFAMSQGPNGLTAGDFNSDGCDDIATANDEGSTSEVVVRIARCNGSSPNFLAADPVYTFATSANTFTVAAAQLDPPDTRVDLLVVNTGRSGTASDKIAMLRNDTTGNDATFTKVQECSAGDAPKGIVVGAFNGANADDWAVANRNSDNISVFLGAGSVTCPTPTSLGAPSEPLQNPVAMAVCDVSRPDGQGNNTPDGFVDILVLDKGSPQQVVIFANDGDTGTFQRKATAINVDAWGSNGTWITCVDRDGDTDNDIVLTNAGSNDNLVLCNQLDVKTGNFNCSVLESGLSDPVNVVFSQFNSSGVLDYCVVNKGNDTVKCSTDGVHAVGSSPVHATLGRFKSPSGLLDLVVAPNGTGMNEVDFLYNNDGGVPGEFAPEPADDISLGNSPSGPANKSTWVASSDLDLDGFADVVSANSNQHDVSVLLGNGDGTYTGPTSYLSSRTPNSVAIADLDCDGYPDVVVADETKDRVSVLPGGGVDLLDDCPDGTTACQYDAGDGPTSVIAVPLNPRDTRPDLVVLNSNSGALTVLLNTTPSCPCECPPCPQ